MSKSYLFSLLTVSAASIHAMNFDDVTPMKNKFDNNTILRCEYNKIVTDAKKNNDRANELELKAQELVNNTNGLKRKKKKKKLTEAERLQNNAKKERKKAKEKTKIAKKYGPTGLLQDSYATIDPDELYISALQCIQMYNTNKQFSPNITMALLQIREVCTTKQIQNSDDQEEVNKWKARQKVFDNLNTEFSNFFKKKDNGDDITNEQTKITTLLDQESKNFEDLQKILTEGGDNLLANLTGTFRSNLLKEAQEKKRKERAYKTAIKLLTQFNPNEQNS